MMEDWSDKAGWNWRKKRTLEMEKGEVDDELEKLIRKVKERVIMKRRKKREGGVSKY